MTFAPLRHREFRRVWTANSVSHLGTWMQTVGAAWLMTQLAPSPLMVALVQTAGSLPFFLIVIPAGTLADIVDKPRYLFFTQTFMAVAAALLGALVLADAVTPWRLLWLTFALGVGTAMNMPAWQSAVSELVPREELPQAASLSNLSFNIARATGPAIGGLLIGVWGASSVFVLNALSFFGVIAILWGWMRRPRARVTAMPRFFAAMAAGFRETMPVSRFRTTLAQAAIFYFGGSALWSLLPAVARDQLHCDATGLGLLMGFLGVGAALAAFALPRLRARHASDRLIAGSAALFGVGQVVVGWSTSFAIVGIALVAAGAAWATVVSELNSRTQAMFSRELRSRAIAIYLFVFYGAMAAGSFAFGAAAAAWGLPWTLVAGSVALAGCATYVPRARAQ